MIAFRCVRAELPRACARDSLQIAKATRVAPPPILALTLQRYSLTPPLECTCMCHITGDVVSTTKTKLAPTHGREIRCRIALADQLGRDRSLTAGHATPY